MTTPNEQKNDIAISIQAIVKDFKARGGRSSGGPSVHRAVNNVSLDLHRGEILGLAGGSGSGKTTLARCVIRLIEPDAGRIMLDGQDILAAKGKELRQIRRRIQMVFQDPYSSLNPRMNIGDAIFEAAKVHRRPGIENREKFISGILDRVHLSKALASRRPRDLSGGQRQRVAIARALAVDPEVLIADEATSALDVSVQAQLLKLFSDLREEVGLSIIFVGHQLATLSAVADRVAVMNQGEVVEIAGANEIFRRPKHEYTRLLLEAHPPADPRHSFFAA